MNKNVIRGPQYQRRRSGPKELGVTHDPYPYSSEYHSWLSVTPSQWSDAHARYALCISENKPLVSMLVCNWIAAAFSVSLEVNCKLLIGQKFLFTSSSPGFLSDGCTKAFFPLISEPTSMFCVFCETKDSEDACLSKI